MTIFSIFSVLCGCICRPTDQPPQDPHKHPHDRVSDPRQHGPLVGSDPRPSTPDGVDTGYTAITPLPAYTPHPVDVHEKTLEAHLRDPPLSSECQCPHPADPDAKSSCHHHYYYYYNNSPHFHHRNSRNNNNNEDLTSDVSSAISFTSSYGNTSTATRETPPPPYSPRGVSPSPSWRLYRQQWANPALSSSSDTSSRRHSRSTSISSATSLSYPGVPPPAPAPPPPVPPLPVSLPMAQVTPPRPVLRRGVDVGRGLGRRSVDETRRFSWESR